MRRAPASLHGLKGAPWLALLVALVVLCAPHVTQAQTVCGVPGKDGAATISGVVNTYHQGTMTANAGSASITVGSSRIGGASVAISTGDLLLVMQMQDATFVSTNDATYGDGGGSNTGSGWTALNSAGLYEYVVATNSITLGGGTITIRGTGASSGLRNTYTNAAANGSSGQKRFQVIRVPQYSTGTLGSVTAPVWDGSTGGVVAFDVAGALSLTGGSVNVTGLGFRGGGSRFLSGDKSNPIVSQPDDYALSSAYPVHGSKGEGIAGTPRYVYNAQTGLIDDTLSEGYPGGSHARGAPGNAGGGGTDSDPNDNQENSGGGGGSNGGAGGKGGNTWQSNSPVGGYGGASFASSAATNRIVMGGGGGGGTKNNDTTTAASTGAAGGGIVMIRAGSYTGAATISANGANAYDDTLNDGGGGGGAGGSVIVMGGSGLGGLTINVNGGNGGDAWRGQLANGNPGERHGPGGGGGGGISYYSSAGGTPLVNRNGGTNGITTTSSSAYGATAGGNGPAPANITFSSTLGASPSSSCIPSLTTTKTTSTANVTNSSSGTTANYTITVVNAANLGSAIQVNISDALPANFTYASTSSVNPTSGATRDSISNPTAGATNPSWGVFSIPGSGQVQITFTVNISQSVLSGTYQNPATATYLDPLRTLANPNNTLLVNYNSASSTAEDVTVTSRADMTIAKSHTGNFTQGQVAATYTITATNSGSGQTSGTVTVTDTVPASLTLTGASGPGWTCNVAPPTATCTRSDALVAPGSYSPITITVNVSATAPASITNTATVSGGGETNVSNNSANDATTINQLPDMTIVKTHTGNFKRGSVGSYNITATNSSTAATNGSTVTVSDTLPAGLTPTGFNTSVGWTCNIATQTVTCTRTDVLAAGLSYPVIGINVNVAQNAAASLTNTASVSGGGQINTANDTSSDATTIVSSSDLSLTKVTSNSGSGVGSNATFTITLTNSGPTDATNVAVKDLLPAGLTYFSSTPSVGGYNSVTGVWTVAALASGANATLQLVATINVTGTLTNTAQVTASDQPDPDSTPNNNIATEDDQASSSLTTAPPSVILCKTIVGQPCPPPPTLPTQAPGTDITYILNFTNTGGSPASALVITDPYIDPALPVSSRKKLNEYTYFKVGSILNTLPAGLTLTSVKYSSDSGVTWIYTPASGAGGAPAGYDANVTHIQWTFGGSLSQNALSNSGSINFTVRIK